MSVTETKIDIKEKLNNDIVKKYDDVLKKKRCSLFLKRAFDIFVSLVMVIILLPFYLIIALMIKLDSKGKVIYKQKRITKGGKEFGIYKFRTMVENADKLGSLVTTDNDPRITKVGKVLRKFRLDETPQILNILKGDMTFVGTRPEVRKYVENYTDEMYATLLMRAGVTSLASIYYKDESTLLDTADDVDKVYVEEVLPGKMKYNLLYIEDFGFWKDVKIMFQTFFAMCGKEYSDKNVDAIKENEEINV